MPDSKDRVFIRNIIPRKPPAMAPDAPLIRTLSLGIIAVPGGEAS